MKITFSVIGQIRSPFHHTQGMPIQPSGAKDIEGAVEVDILYEAGLADIEQFSHITLIYLFHRSKGFELQVKPFLDDAVHGVFATRAPRRPNPIGISTVALLKRDRNILLIKGVDVLDGTPLLDIKPYVPEFDVVKVSSVGWLGKKQRQARTQRSDNRFNPGQL
jgi:tRNA-Thr(GGU) m(6)t(6)A37 methyltransferase TsaA